MRSPRSRPPRPTSPRSAWPRGTGSSGPSAPTRCPPSTSAWKTSTRSRACRLWGCATKSSGRPRRSPCTCSNPSTSRAPPGPTSAPPSPTPNSQTCASSPPSSATTSPTAPSSPRPNEGTTPHDTTWSGEFVPSPPVPGPVLRTNLRAVSSLRRRVLAFPRVSSLLPLLSSVVLPSSRCLNRGRCRRRRPPLSFPPWLLPPLGGGGGSSLLFL
mmetsp:Transcript_2096/g.6216  ORF Transcript_2096/g.6216 Transcript_2096/m.6216 type:complete len:213 (-) Transcript_2096:81-719(-)